jgi:hypothetical protein
LFSLETSRYGIARKRKEEFMLSNRMGNTICGLACGATILAGFGTASASAQTIDERTFFTFSGPVELPGVSLVAGTYMFRLPSPENAHSVVQVMSADGKKTYGTFFTLPVQRAMLPNQAEIRFMESAAGAPPAVQAWWYLDDSTGFEFIYPKAQARRGATTAGESVRTTHTHSATTAAEPVTDN